MFPRWMMCSGVPAMRRRARRGIRSVSGPLDNPLTPLPPSGLQTVVCPRLSAFAPDAVVRPGEDSPRLRAGSAFPGARRRTASPPRRSGAAGENRCTTCRPKRCVRRLSVPKRGRAASTRTKETRLRRNRISKLPMVRSSSRTETAMSENESRAPTIHSAPRSAAGSRDKPGTDHSFAVSLFTDRLATSWKPWSVPGFPQPRAGKSLRSSRREAP